MSKPQLVWKKKPEAEDYHGALSFLSLIGSNSQSKKLVRALREAKTIETRRERSVTRGQLAASSAR